MAKEVDERGFSPGDYEHTAKLLLSLENIRQAASSNNHNIILAALFRCAGIKLGEEPLGYTQEPALVSSRERVSTPWTITVWVICQNYRPFDYRFSRAAAFDRAKELREGAPSGKWSVEQRTAQISLLDRGAAPGVIHAEAQA